MPRPGLTGASVGSPIRLWKKFPDPRFLPVLTPQNAAAGARNDNGIKTKRTPFGVLLRGSRNRSGGGSMRALTDHGANHLIIAGLADVGCALVHGFCPEFFICKAM